MNCLFGMLTVSATSPARVLTQFAIRGVDNISNCVTYLLFLSNYAARVGVTLLQVSLWCHVVTFRTNLSQIRATEYQFNLTFDCRISAVDDHQVAIYHHPRPSPLVIGHVAASKSKSKSDGTSGSQTHVAVGEYEAVHNYTPSCPQHI